MIIIGRYILYVTLHVVSFKTNDVPINPRKIYYHVNVRIHVYCRNMADRKSDSMQKLVQSAMRKPGMKERLAQVVPIIKAMTPAQRLALAGMVMGKGQSQNLNNKALNAQLLLPISQDIAAMLRNGQSTSGGDGGSSARASSGYGVR